uniref:Uncharacterized protein n=1 Tax=Oryza barthii TaxID=65489 RepID=A0A0D3G8W6_9ORYZ
MGNSLRCCLACMLPCGALDVVRVVHLSGRVDEKIVIVSPDSELKRGRIYFLIPSACSAPAADKMMTRRKKKKRCHGNGNGKGGSAAAASTAEQDNYLMELLSEKRGTSHRRRRSGARAGVWRPQLESIAEEPSD